MNTFRRAGYSIVEMLVVIAIISMLSSLILGVLMHFRKEFATSETKASLRNIVAAIRSYEIMHKQLPKTLTELFGAQEHVPRDAWGQLFIYEASQRNQYFDLYSIGSDGQRNTRDDVRFNDNNLFK
jgi:prepilin-type N-terminal cleavage/methylation domain-containing protein